LAKNKRNADDTDALAAAVNKKPAESGIKRSKTRNGFKTFDRL